jgi:hypothetical protein
MAEVFDLAEFSRALQHVSDDIKREVGALVPAAANRVKDRVQAAYPVGPTGNLRRMVRVGQPARFISNGAGDFIPTLQVKAFAPHVWIWQEGTVERFDSTRRNARRGRSPKHGKVFEAIAARTRAGMLNQAQAILDRPRKID